MNNETHIMHSMGQRYAVLEKRNEIRNVKNCEGIFPRFTIWVLHAIVMITRVAITANRKNWWILHPDEVFQSIEVAHSEVYGYGFRPYEFLPCSRDNVTSLLEQRELLLGMCSLRSFLYPRIYVTLFLVKEFLGIEGSPFAVAKIFHGIVAAHLPLSVYYFTSHIITRDTAILSAIFCASSVHLTILGTHPLVNSFISPIFFLSLGVATRSFRAFHTCKSHRVFRDAFAPSNRDNSRKSISIRGIGSKSTDVFDACERANNRIPSNKRNWKRTANVSASRLNCNCMGYLEVHKNIETSTTTTTTTTIKECEDPIVFKLSSAVHSQAAAQTAKLFISGFVMGLLCYIRLDLSLFKLLVFMSFLFVNLRCFDDSANVLMCLCVLLVGYGCGVVTGGLDDYVTYGIWFVSPFNWLYFNVKTNHANVIFGTETVTYYFRQIILNDTQSVCLLLLISIYVVLFALNDCFRRTIETRKSLLLFAPVFLFMSIAYSLKGHKEIRFLHNVIVLFEIISATSVIELYTFASRVLHAKQLHTIGVFVAGFAISVHVYNVKSIAYGQQFPEWCYMNSSTSQFVNECLDFIGRQNDTRGVFLETSLYATAGYSVLHTDVPIFTLVHNEFTEFDKNSRLEILANWFPTTEHRTINVSTTGRVADFIAAANKPYLLKAIANSPLYNYAVVKNYEDFVKIGFREIYRSERIRVMKRERASKEGLTRQTISETIPVGGNGTALEYEGGWLYSMGLYSKAIERLETAVSLDNSLVRAFQVLALAYDKVGAPHVAQLVIRHCEHNNGKGSCSRHENAT